jgi:hypothetical protein
VTEVVADGLNFVLAPQENVRQLLVKSFLLRNDFLAVADALRNGFRRLIRIAEISLDGGLLLFLIPLLLVVRHRVAYRIDGRVRNARVLRLGTVYDENTLGSPLALRFIFAYRTTSPGVGQGPA